MISSQGRGVFDCNSGEKLARDYGDGEWFNERELHCQGIGPIESESISTCGHGVVGCLYVINMVKVLRLWRRTGPYMIYLFAKIVSQH